MSDLEIRHHGKMLVRDISVPDPNDSVPIFNKYLIDNFANGAKEEYEGKIVLNTYKSTTLTNENITFVTDADYSYSSTYLQLSGGNGKMVKSESGFLPSSQWIMDSSTNGEIILDTIGSNNGLANIWTIGESDSYSLVRSRLNGGEILHIKGDTNEYLDMWFKLKVKTPGMLFEKFDVNGFQCGIDVNGEIGFLIKEGGNQEIFLLTSDNLEIDTWYHLAFHFKNDGIVYPYIDGVAAVKDNPTGIPNTYEFLTTLANFYIGQVLGEFKNIYYLEGAGTDVSSIVAYRYNSGVPIYTESPTATLAWHLDDNIKDTIGTTNFTIEDSSSETYSDNGIVSTNLIFVDSDSIGQISNSSHFSIDGWIYIETQGTSNYIFKKYDRNGKGFHLLINSTGQPELHIANSDALYKHIIYDSTLVTGQWYHIAWIHRTWELYVGSLSQSELEITDTGLGVYNITEGDFTFGPLTGKIDEFLAYNKTVTSAYVSGRFNGNTRTNGNIYTVTTNDYWYLDDASSPFTNSGARSATMIDTGGSTTTTAKLGTYARNFTQVDKCILSTSADHKWNTTSKFSIEAWIKNSTGNGQIFKSSYNEVDLVNAQYIEVENTSYSAPYSLSGSGAWQSFVPSTTGYITIVSTYLDDLTDNFFNIEYKLYSGEGIGGTLLATETRYYLYSTKTWLDVTLASPIYVIAGNTYTLNTRAITGNAVIEVRYSNVISGRFISNANYDAAIRIYMRQVIHHPLIRLYTDTSKLIFSITDDTDTITATSNQTINDGNWKHILVTYDGSQSVLGMVMYINGSFDSSGTTGTNVSTIDYVGKVVDIHTCGAITLGNNITIDEYVIYDDYIVNQTEVESRYNVGSGTRTLLSNNILSHYEFAGNLLDTSGNSRTLSLFHTNIFADDAIILDAISGNIEMETDPVAFNFEHTDSFSIECSIKLLADEYGDIIRKMNDSSTRGYKLGIHGASGYPEFYLKSTDTNYYHMRWAFDFCDGTWQQMIVTWNGTTAALYVDNNTPKTPTLINNTLTTTILVPAEKLTFGRYTTGLHSNSYVYNSALSTTFIGNRMSDNFAEFYPTVTWHNMTVNNDVVPRGIFSAMTDMSITEVIPTPVAQQIKYMFIIGFNTHYIWTALGWTLAQIGDTENGNTKAQLDTLSTSNWQDLIALYDASTIKSFKILIGFYTTDEAATPEVSLISYTHTGYIKTTTAEISLELVDTNGVLSSITNISGAPITQLLVRTLRLT